MGKKRIGSSARGKRAGKSVRRARGNRIDFTDIPELTDKQLKQMKRPGRPILGQSKRQMIAIRMDENVLQRLKKEAAEEGKGYQSLINEILNDHVKKRVA